MRRDDICNCVSPTNCTRLTALISDRSTRSKVVRRAKIVLATADGYGSSEIMRQQVQAVRVAPAGVNVVAGVEQLMRDKTRPSRKAPRWSASTAARSGAPSLSRPSMINSAATTPLKTFVWTETAEVNSALAADGNGVSNVKRGRLERA